MDTCQQHNSRSADIEGDAGIFGHWIQDDNELPAFSYECDQYADSRALTPTAGTPSRDQWHQVGNDRLTATAHNAGHLNVMVTDRGMQWISYRYLPARSLGGGIAFVQEGPAGESYSDLFSSKKHDFKREFGIGYYRKVVKTSKICMDHKIFAPFGNDPVLISVARIQNLSPDPITLRYTDYWGLLQKYMILSWMYLDRDRTKYGNSRVISLLGNGLKWGASLLGFASEEMRLKFANQFTWAFNWDPSNQILTGVPSYMKRPPVKPEDTSDRDYFPPPVFLAPLQAGEFTPATALDWTTPLPTKIHYNLKFRSQNQGILGNCLALTSTLTIPPSSAIEIAFAFGTVVAGTDIQQLLLKYRTGKSQEMWTTNAKSWKENLLSVGGDMPAWVPRELAWHSYYTRSALMYDAYYKTHFFPQGSGYSFLHGANGAIRDYALYTIPAIYLWPDMAREHLILMCKLMRPNGELPYSHSGIGKLSGAMVHDSSSDIYLFFLWAVSEYVYFTRDFEFLDVVLPYYGAKDFPRAPSSGSILAHVVLAIRYLIQRIGTGEHGLIRVGSGDWSDGIQLMVQNRGKFLKHGESTFNSAFALYIIPKVMPLLETRAPSMARPLQRFYEKAKDAVAKTWNGRWYYRGYDGGGIPIGDKNLFLEHHAWLLIANAIPPRHAEVLLHNIEALLERPAKAGQFICYPPQKTLLNILPFGWDVNGGIWAAINFLLTWGYANYAPERAWSSFVRNSLHSRALAYPNQWYGIWSAPDAYNADYAIHAGETFNHVPTPQVNFPVMNLNSHAGNLGAFFKLCGIESTFDGLRIIPRLDFPKFSFKTPVFSLEWNPREISGTIVHHNARESILSLCLRQVPSSAIQLADLNGQNLQISENLDNGIKFSCPASGFRFRARVNPEK